MWPVHGSFQFLCLSQMFWNCITMCLKMSLFQSFCKAFIWEAYFNLFTSFSSYVLYYLFDNFLLLVFSIGVTLLRCWSSWIDPLLIFYHIFLLFLSLILLCNNPFTEFLIYKPNFKLAFLYSLNNQYSFFTGAASPAISIIYFKFSCSQNCLFWVSLTTCFGLSSTVIFKLLFKNKYEAIPNKPDKAGNGWASGQDGILFSFFWGGGGGRVAMLHSSQDLISPNRNWTCTFSVKAQSPNHWEFLGWHSLRVEPIKCQCSTQFPLGYVLPKKNVSPWVRQQTFW